MSKTKKWTSLIFAIILGVLTCGVGLALPSFSKQSSKLETVTAVNYDAAITESQLTTDSNGFYQISSAKELTGVAKAIAAGQAGWASANYALTADINLADALWTPIGTLANPFVGKFNGNGHTISGAIGVEASSYDSYVGLFGVVGKDNTTQAAIYDLVLGSYNFTPSYTELPTAGRLAGKVQNVVLADIYDWAYINMPTSLNYQTIGTIGSNAIVYGGDTFVLGSVSSDGTWTRDLKTPSNYTPIKGVSFQFGYAEAAGSLTERGRSVYIVDDETGIFYKNGDSTKTDLGSLRILKNSGGAAIDAATVGIISDKYTTDLPTIIGNTATTSGLTLEPASTGKKPLHYAESATATSGYTSIAAYSGNGPLYVVWKDLSYNITVTYNGGSINLGTFGFNTPVGSQLNETDPDGANDFLSQITNGRPGFTPVSLSYNSSEIYSAAISWTEEGNKSGTETFSGIWANNQQYLRFWDDAWANQEEPIAITLSSEWISQPVNFQVTFDPGDDAGVDLAGFGISATYNESESIPEDYRTITPYEDDTTSDIKVFDVQALSGEGITFTITIPAGHEITGVSGANVSYTSGNTFTLSEATASGDITISVARIEYTIDIVATNYETISVAQTDAVSGATPASVSDDGDGTWTLTVRVGNTFNLVATASTGYEYASHSVEPTTTEISFGSVTTANEKTVVTIPVTINEVILNDLEIELTASAKEFNLNVHFNSEQYTGHSTVKPGGVKISWAPGDGSQTIAPSSTGSSQEAHSVAVPVPTSGGVELTITAAADSYYYVSSITISGPGITGNANMTQDASDSNRFTYTITSPAGGSDYTVTVNYEKQTYSPTVTTGSTTDVDSTDFATTIPGADGNAVANDSVITVTNPAPYSPFDTLTFSYSTISDYYLFTGWYYKDGDVYRLIGTSADDIEPNLPFDNVSINANGDLSFSAPAQNVTIAAAVTGKTAEITLPTDARDYYEIGSTITDAEDALSSGSSSVTFKYGAPNSGSITTTMDTGYNLSRVVIGTGNLTSVDNTLSSTYVLFGTSGYAPVQDNEDILRAIFIDKDAQIYILAAPKSIEVTFDPGEGTTELVGPITETYYYNVSLDATRYANDFTKEGYSGSGWTLSDGLSNTGITSNEFNIDFMRNAAAAGRPVTATRTYTANSFSLSLNPNGGEFAENIKTAYGGTLATENDYASVFTFTSTIAFDAAISSILGSNAELPTPTRTGYNFMGWQIGSETITAATVWDWVAGQTAVAKWEAKNYDLVIHLNGGVVQDASDIPEIADYDAEAGTVTLSGMPYEQVFDSIIFGSLNFITRNGFDLVSLAHVTGAGESTNIDKFLATSSTIFNTTNFPHFDFDNSTSIDVYMEWAFEDNAFTASMNGDQSFVYTGSAQTFGNLISVTDGYGLNITPTVEWKYSKTETGNIEGELPTGVVAAGNYGLSLTNVSDSGYYSAILTFVDTASITALQDTFEINLTTGTSRQSVNLTITPAQLLQFNNQAIDEKPFSMRYYGLFTNAKNVLTNYPNARTILSQSMGNGPDYISQFDIINNYSDFVDWVDPDGNLSGVDDYNRFGFVAKIVLIPMLYDVNMRDILLDHPEMASIFATIDEHWTDVGTGNTYVNGYLTSYTDADLSNGNSTKLNQIFDLLSVLADMYTDFDSSIWNSQVSSAFTSKYATKEADVVTIDIKAWDTSKTFVISNDAGAKYLAYRFTPGTSFNANNFLNTVQVNFENTSEYASYSGYYVVIDQYYLHTAMGWPEFSPILYAPTTVLELPVTEVLQTGLEWTGETKEFNLSTATNDKYTQVVATVQTSAATPGTYSFIEKADEDGTPFGRLIIKSFKLYVFGTSETENQEDTAYYIFNRESDGSYTLGFKNGANIPREDWISAQDPVLANISLAIEQDLKIIETNAFVPISFQTVALYATSDGAGLDGDFVTGDSTATVTINSVTVQKTGGESFKITIGSDGTNYDIYENGYYDTDGALIFSISGQTIQFNKNSGYSLADINVTSSYNANNYKFAGYYTWTGGSADGVDDGNDIDIVETAVKGLLKWADTTQTLTDTYFMTEGTLAETYISAVYTNASWVIFDAKTDDTGEAFTDGFDSDSSRFFATIGGTVNFANYDSGIDYNIYTFDGFGKNEISKVVTVANAPNQTFTAVIGLEAPDVSMNTQNFAAQLEGNLDLSTLAKHVNITYNGSAHGITYIYTWYNSDPSAEGASAITSIPANASSDGSYYVVVTATKAGFENSEAAQASFAIAFEKTTLSLTAPTGSLTQTYKNEDFRNDITIGVALANDQASDLPTYPAGISLSAILSDSTLGSILDVTIQKQTEEGAWEDVADGIINAGTYQITVALKPDVNVGNAYEYASETGSITFIFTVTKKVVKINAGPGEGTVTTSDDTVVDDGVLFSKSLDYTSDANRVYSVNVAVDGITGISHISLNLKRADDTQTAGYYKLVINTDETYTALSANYDISIDDNNTWFRILPSSGGLQAIATVVEKADPDNGIVNNTRIYNGADHSSTVRIEKAIKEGTEDEYEFQLVTYLVYNGDGDSNNVEWARYSLVLQTASDEDETPEKIDITLDTSFFEGWTFTLVSGANVGSYVISCSGTNDNYPSFEFIGGTTPTLEIVEKELTISSISMEYNGTSSFTLNTETSNNEGNTQKFVVNGLVGSEDLEVKITFSESDLGTYTYGAAENWLNASLSNGTSGLADNYSLNLTGVSGQIIQSTEQLNLAMANNSFEYGQDGFDKPTLEASLDSLIEKLGFSVTIGSGEATKTVGSSLYTIHIVSLTPEEAMENVYSNATYLKAGKYIIGVELTSNYYTVTDSVLDSDVTHSFTLTVEKKQITASPTTFTKDYDGDANVEQAITFKDKDIVEGDVVSALGEYDNENVGPDKTVTITLSGTDSANYTLTNHEATGAINPATIILNARFQNDKQEDRRFVDGLLALVDSESGPIDFEIQYQNDMDAADTLALLTAPTKLGYTFNGWAVGTVGDTDEAVPGFDPGTILNEDNILSFLGAIRENTDDYTASIYATWTINTYKITVTDSTDMGDHDVIEELKADSQSTEDNTTTYTYSVDYYTTWTFTRVANSGYVLQGEYSETFDFTYSSVGEGGAETNLTDKTFTVVDGHFRAAVININISVDTEKNYYGQWNAGESTYNFTFANLDGDGNDGNNGEAVWEIDSMHIGVSSLEGVASTDLASTNIQTYFARAALAGYSFSGWSYKVSSESESVTIDYNAEEPYLLSNIVSAIYPSGYTDDITISITAVLKAETYSLTLNPDGGAFAENVESTFGGTLATGNDYTSNFTFTKPATYGEAISDAIVTLPIPTKTGFTFAGWEIRWTDADETTHSVTISTISEDSATTNDTIWQWASDMTATAIWSEGNFTLTVTLDTGDLVKAGASVKITDSDGTEVSLVDNAYTLNHAIKYTITVTPNEGYVISWPSTESVSGFTLTETATENTYTISGIYANSALEITITADSHTVRIVPPTNGDFKVSITGATDPQVSGPFNAEDEEGNLLYIYYTFNAATEQTIVVTITPYDGYSVTRKPTADGFDISNESNGPNESKVFTITNFISDITIDFSEVVTANSYNMTVTYDSTISVAGLTDGSSSTDEGDTTYTVLVSTGTSYTFYIQEVYGYNYSDISRNGTADVAVSDTAETEGEYDGYKKVTVSGYTAAFDLTIVTTKDVFTVNADWVAVDSGFNIMDSGFNIQESVDGISVAPETQDFEYLSQATITATNSNSAYGFIGWFDASVVGDGTVNIEGEPLSKNLTYKPTVKGDINVIALFQYQTYKVNISIEYTDRVVGTNHASFKIGENKDTYPSYSGTMSHNTQLSVTAVPAAGYKLVGWYVGTVDEPADSTEATFTTTITDELTLIMLIDASDLEVTFTPTVRINGVSFSGENIADLDYGKIELGTYEASTGSFAPIEDWPEGNNFVAQSYTGGTLYLRVSAKEGYEFNGLNNLSGGPTFSQISATENIYSISNLNSTNSYNVEVRFTAISTPINIVFSDGENRLEAGRITVTNANGLNIVQNNTHNVTVHAITGSQVRVTAYISLGQGFKDPENALNNLRITTSSGTIEEPKITIPEASTGWSAQISFEITDFTGTPVVEVLVKPKTYTVNLVGWDSSPLGSFEVTYGAPIVLPEGLTISPRDGFALLGFYKYANGVGTRFIDGDLNPIGNWTDNGYRRNSDGAYVVTDNFDPDNNTFEIYASYSINKARLQIDVVPPGLENLPPTVAANIVVLGTTTANSWSSSEDPSFVEVREGATISVQAPVYENYRFAYWTIVRTNRAGASTREIVTSELIENFEHDGYSLVAMTLTYYANVGVVANGNGSASLTYWDEINEQLVEVTGSEYIPTTSPITLNATPDEGYNFIGWFTQDGQLLTMNSNYEVSASLANPLSPTTYEARFESQTFRMNITVRNPEAISIQTVSVAGQQVADFANGFDVKLGQMVTLTVAVAQNTNIAWDGVGALIPMLNNRYIYTVSYSDLVDGEINLEAYVSYEECDVNISVNLTNGIETEKSLAANIYYFEDSQPIQISAINGVTLRRVIGSTLELRIDLRANYKLDSILIDGVDSGATLDGNIARIVLTPQDAYADTIDIQVNIARDMWLDSVSSEEHTLSGEGTDSNPYMVRTADDLAFVAYMINVENSTEYADAVYVLDADIDLSGRYWSPIGTESNPFNGKFYYRNYSISNVSVVYNYSGDLTRGGVFGYITENAEFEMPQGDWLIAVIIVSVVLLLIIIALIIFFVIRNKRKKKLEQLANS